MPEAIFFQPDQMLLRDRFGPLIEGLAMTPCITHYIDR